MVDIDSIVKRYISPMDGAVSFGTVLLEEIKCEQYYEATERVSPLLCSLNTSLYSIAGDSNYDDATKLTMARSTIEDFMTTLRATWGEVDAFMMAAISKAATKEKDMDQIAKLNAQIAEMQKELEEAKKNGAKISELEKSLAKAAADLEKANAALAEATAKASLDDAEREYVASLEKSERDDFLKMSKKARAEVIKKSLEDDEVIKVEGRTIRKSKVGEDMFAILKAQEARSLEIAKTLDEERERRISTELTAKAESDYGHLPGTAAEKAEVLKAVEEMPEAARDTLTKMLVAGNGAIKSAFGSVGRGGDISPVTGLRKSADGKHPFLAKVAEIRKRDSVGQHVAMNKARNEFPEEYNDYNRMESN